MVEQSQLRRDLFVSLLTESIDKGSLRGGLLNVHRPCRKLIDFSDFMNESIKRALMKSQKFNGHTEGELVAWIKIIGQNLMLDMLRRSKVRRTVPLPIQLQDSSAISPEESLSQIEDLAWLDRAMVHNATWVEISSHLNIPHNTLAQRHVRLLKKLRTLREGKPFQ
jgi:hypothetical protein